MRRALFLVTAILSIGGPLAAWAVTQDPVGGPGTNGLPPLVYWSNLPALQQRMLRPLTTAGALEPAFGSILNAPGSTRLGDNKKLVEYAIDCAVRGTVQGSAGSFKGTQLLSTTGGWLTTPLDRSQREDLHACLAARLNPTGNEVSIWLGGPHVTNGIRAEVKPEDFPLDEALWAAVEEPAGSESQAVASAPPKRRPADSGNARQGSTDKPVARQGNMGQFDTRRGPGNQLAVRRDHRNRPGAGQGRADEPVATADRVDLPTVQQGRANQIAATQGTANQAIAVSGKSEQPALIPSNTVKPEAPGPQPTISQDPRSLPKVTVHVWPSETVRASCSYGRTTTALSNRICARVPGACRIVEHSREETSRSSTASSEKACEFTPNVGWSCKRTPDRPREPVIQTRMKCQDWCTLYPDCSIPDVCAQVAPCRKP